MEANLNEHTWRLTDPGMGLLERAGLAGLAMTLKAAAKAGHDLSPLQWTDTDITADAVTIRWAGATKPAFQKLIEWAWQAPDGVLYFPAVHDGLDVSNWHLRVPMHSGIMRTFLQHTNVQPKGASVSRIVQIGEDREQAITFQPPIIREADPGEKPRALLAPWADYCKLFSGDEIHAVVTKPLTWINPGMAGRYGKETNWKSLSDRALLLMHAPMVCLYMKLPKTKVAIKGASKWVDNWVVAVPDVRDLVDFAKKRRRMYLASDFVDVASLGDAGLRFLAEFGSQELRKDLIAGCHVIAMGHVTYYANQSVRKGVLDVPPRTLAVRRYRRLHSAFPNPFVRRKADPPPDQAKKSGAKKKSDQSAGEPQGNGWFKVPTGRGRIADNLVAGQPWYRDLFVPLAWDEQELENLRRNFKARENAGYSRETTWFYGLCLQWSKLMRLITEDDMWDTEAEKVFVEAFWETMDSLFAQEANAVRRGGSASVEKRWKRLKGEIYRSLMQAKTRPLLRSAVAGWFARAGRPKSVAAHAPAVWRLIDHPDHWQKGRDLALVGLASHRKKSVREGKEPDTDSSDLETQEA